MASVQAAIAKANKVKFDIRWDSDELEDIRDISSLTGKSMAFIVREATKRYIAKEKPRLAKLAALRAKLLPS